VGGCKADLREIGYESGDWVELIQCGSRWSRSFLDSPGNRDILISLITFTSHEIFFLQFLYLTIKNAFISHYHFYMLIVIQQWVKLWQSFHNSSVLPQVSYLYLCPHFPCSVLCIFLHWASLPWLCVPDVLVSLPCFWCLLLSICDCQFVWYQIPVQVMCKTYTYYSILNFINFLYCFYF